MKKTRLPLGKIDRPRSDVAPEKKACDMKPELMKGLIMRRKLMFALLGGLLMQNIVPLDAVGAADKPSDDEITEEMILEFLQNLFKVIKHDDLADLEFIEQTLGVKAAQALERGVVAGRKMTSYILTEPKSRVFLDMPGYFNEYVVGQPLSGGKVVVDMRIRISTNKPHQPDITVKNMESIFGKPPISHFFELVHGADHLPISYAYRWQNQNDVVAEFVFQRDTGSLVSVDVFQNDDTRLKYFPLK